MFEDKHELQYIDDWPPNSPDLNPIKGVWRILKQRVKKWKVHNTEELREAIEAEWNAIMLEEINELIVGKKKHWQK